MKSRCLAAASLALCLSSTAGAQPPPVEAFAALPAMQSPSLSPDGKRLAFLAQSAEASFVMVSNIETMAVSAAVNTSAVKPRDIMWASDDALLVLSSETLTPRGVPVVVESTAPYGIDLTGDLSVNQLLTQGPRLSSQGGGATSIGGYRILQGAQLIGFRRSTGDVLFPMRDRDAKRSLYAVDAKTDRRRVLDWGTRDTRDWVVDENGEPRFRVEYTQKSDYFQVLGRGERGWEIIAAETIEIPELALHGLGPDGELVVGLRPADVGRFGLYVMSAENGAIERPFYVHDRLDVSAVRIDPYSNRVIGAGVVGESPVWFDAAFAAQQASLEEAFRGESPRIVSWSEDRTRFIVSTERADRAPAHYLFDAKELTAKQIASTNVELDRGKLAPRVAYSYQARDGVEIPGYLTRPLDVEGATPLIVLPHGGPAARDVAGYDWLAHFFASRGYAVLQPNFRGSRGYGKEWEEAGHGEWGIGVMQHDLTDGVAALVAARIADPERVCIVGASYGGYAALAGAVFTPDIYRCAAAIAPVTDLGEMLELERGRAGGLSATVSYWRLAMGVDETGSARERLEAASPARHAEHVQAPVLLIHGRDDTVVPLTQSETMQRALLAAGKTVELVALDGEDHWLSGSATRLKTLRALDTFLARHLAE